jgi:hypothetical protein
MEALATAAQEAAKASYDESEEMEEEKEDENNQNEEFVQVNDVEDIVENEDDDDLPKAEVVVDYEVNEFCLTLWNQSKLLQVKNTCCANSFCLMKAVSVPLSQEGSRCAACGFASHLSCRLQLKDNDHKVCRSCGKTDRTGRRIEIEISDELQEEMLKDKRNMKLEFVSKKQFNEIIMEYEDGLYDEDDEEESTDDSDGELFIE